MDFTPILTTTTMIKVHMGFAVPAVVLGPFVLFRARRDLWHKALGYLWLTSMLGLATSGLLIASNMAILWHFGPIHLFSAFTLWSVAEGLYHIKRGNIARHKATMESLWFGAVGLAGLFTFLPGRILSRILFGDNVLLAWIVLGAALSLLLYFWRSRRLQIWA